MCTSNSYLVNSGLTLRTANSAAPGGGATALGGAFGAGGGFADPAWQLAQFALLVAACVHDVGHIGCMNPHLKATGHPLALEYPDRAGILEAMHAAVALEMMRAPGQDILECMEPTDGSRVRQAIVDLVLVTDLTKQAAFLDEFHGATGPRLPAS